MQPAHRADPAPHDAEPVSSVEPGASVPADVSMSDAATPEPAGRERTPRYARRIDCSADSAEPAWCRGRYR